MTGSAGTAAAQDHGQYDARIREASRLYSIPEALIRAVIRVESNFNPNVVSPSGARGLMQLMPRTARSMGVRRMHDPRENILGGTRCLRVLANHYGGDITLTLAAYNAGRARVDRHLRHGWPLPEPARSRYVPRVLMYFREYSRTQS